MSETSLTIGGAGSYVLLPKDLYVAGVYDGKDIFGRASDIIPEFSFGPYIQIFGKIGALAPESTHGLAANLIWNGGSEYNRFVWDIGWKHLSHPVSVIEPYFEVMVSGSHLLVDAWKDPYHQFGLSFNAGCNFYLDGNWAITIFLKDHLFIFNKSGSGDFKTTPQFGVQAGLGVTWSFGKKNPIAERYFDQADKHLLKMVRHNMEKAAMLKDPKWPDRHAKELLSGPIVISFPVLEALKDGLEWFFSDEIGEAQNIIGEGFPSVQQYMSAIYDLTHASYGKYATTDPSQVFDMERQAYELLGDVFVSLLMRLEKETVGAATEANAFVETLNKKGIDSGDLEEQFAVLSDRIKTLQKLVSLAKKVCERLSETPLFYNNKTVLELWNSRILGIQGKMDAIPTAKIESLIKTEK